MTTLIEKTTSTTAEYRLGQHFMVRVGGLPIQALRELRDPQTAAFARAVLDREDDLARRGANLSDELHESVGGLADADSALRNALLAVRREVFHNKLPRKAERIDEFAGALDAGTADRLRGWIADRADLDSEIATGDEPAAVELATARARLQARADDARLRPAVLLASASLDKYLDSYRDADGTALSKRQRRLERSLLEYVYRAGAKTSPFSSFTGVALGRFEAGADDRLSAAIDPEWTSFARINVAVVARLATLITDSPELRADLPVSLTSGWMLEGERIRYVRRELSTGDDEATVSFDAVRDSLFFLRASGNLTRMIELFDERPLVTYRDLVHTLADESHGDPAEYDRYLAVLLKLSLLQVPALELDIHHPDPLRGFRDALAGLSLPWASELAGRLDPAIALVASYPDADLADRRRTVSELRGVLTEIAASLGDDAATLPHSLIFEDCRAVARTLAVDGAGFQRTVGRSLTELCKLLPAVDPMLAHRQLLKGFFLARYGAGGRCDDLLELIQSFHEDIYDQYVRISSRRKPFDADGYHPLENWLGRPEITALDAAREALARGVAERAADLAPDVDLVLDKDLVAEVAAAAAPAAPAFTPWSLLLQIGQPVDGPRTAVLNHAYGGLSFPFSRFVDCLDQGASEHLDDELRAGLEHVRPAGAVFAEVTGGFVTTNLNLHARLTDYEIVCPGETSSAPASARLRLGDLYAEHDRDSDRLVLRSPSLEHEVVPAYLGYLVPMALPEIPRTLLLFAPTSAAQFDIWNGVPDTTVDGVARRPRVRIGDLVLTRRSWTVDADRMPTREPGSSDLDGYLMWRRWQRGIGLPDRVFASRLPADGEDQAPGDAKPLYVDFDSQLSIGLLESVTAGGTGRISFEEMAPDEHGLWAHSAAGDHVAELVIELSTSHLPMAAEAAVPTETETN